MLYQEIMNYLKYLMDARLINMVYRPGEEFPKKPSRILLHNSNMNYCVYPRRDDKEEIIETFFYNQMMKGHQLSIGDKRCSFLVDGKMCVKLCSTQKRRRISPDITYIMQGERIGKGKDIPLWLFGFLY